MMGQLVKEGELPEDSVVKKYLTTTGTAQRVDLYYSARLPEAHQYLQALVRENQEELRKKVRDSKLYFCVAIGSLMFNIFLMAILLAVS